MAAADAVANGSHSAAELLQALYKAPDAQQEHLAAERLADHVNARSLRCLETEGILESLLSACRNKKSGFEREAGAVGIGALADKVAGKNAPSPLGAEPWLLPACLPTLLDLYADKGDVVRQAAQSAVASLFSLPPPEATPELLSSLYGVLEGGATKWQAKVGALKLVSRLSEAASEQVAEQLVELIPHLKNAMGETKPEVAKQALKTTRKVVGVIDNNDIRPHLDSLVETMRAPDSVAECIKRLSSTTFVAEVTGPALAVMVPLLARALNERSATVQRQVCIIVENLTKLVRDPHEAVKFLPALTPGVERVAQGAAFPEVRQHAESALETLRAATKSVGESRAVGEDPRQAFADAKRRALEALRAAVEGCTGSGSDAGGGGAGAVDGWAMVGLDWVASLVVRLSDKRIVQAQPWDEAYVLPYLRRVCRSDQDARSATDEVRSRYVALDEERFGAPEDDDADAVEGECLCNIEFSLAYGGLLLLNHTRLRLHRGQRYGVVAANGSGKSTLLKAMRDGKVESFPTEEQGLRTVMVEHNQGDDGEVRIVDYVYEDEKLRKMGTSRDEVERALREVGFDDERRANTIGSLSGGWKMKLALARAMLIGADILLLDEPTNHLDVQSVAWLEKYLVSNPNITVLTVSHDSGFLDNVCTMIMHYENKKIKYYKGNLSAFVGKRPEAKSYYSLAATTVRYTFPPPGSLMGVRSKTRTILKVQDATYTYAGAAKPSLSNASVAVSLSSRVGVQGPNGAGKSTLIKIMTEEVKPQSGLVTRHPNLRTAMMAQHAFHHIEAHLHRSAVDYIMWRFGGGTDKELAEKASRKLSDEERAELQRPIADSTGSTARRIEAIIGRTKQKRSYIYEIKWQGLQHRDNSWIPRERLLELGFHKLVSKFDDEEASREGAGSKELSHKLVRKHLEAVGLNGEIAEHHEMSGLSGGQKVKVVLAAALWNNPQVLFLDEPTNYLDRDSLGGLAMAIRDWGGAVIIISHNLQFVEALCSEIWHVEGGRITAKTRTALATDHFADDDEAAADGTSTPGAAGAGGASVNASGTATPTTTLAGSKAASRLNSAAATPAGSDDEGGGGGDEGEEDDPSKFKAAKGKKKKMTRNEKKAQEERRKQRKLRWLIEGGEREPDTDEEGAAAPSPSAANGDAAAAAASTATATDKATKPPAAATKPAGAAGTNGKAGAASSTAAAAAAKKAPGGPAAAAVKKEAVKTTKKK